MSPRVGSPAMLLCLGDQPMDGAIGRFDECSLPHAAGDPLRRPFRDLVYCVHSALPIVQAAAASGSYFTPFRSIMRPEERRRRDRPGNLADY
jgi:hypothetical protein